MSLQKSHKRHHLQILRNLVHNHHDVRDLVLIPPADDDDSAGVWGAKGGFSPEEFLPNITPGGQVQLGIGNLSMEAEIQDHTALGLENIGAFHPDKELLDEFPAQVGLHSGNTKE